MASSNRDVLDDTRDNSVESNDCLIASDRHQGDSFSSSNSLSSSSPSTSCSTITEVSNNEKPMMHSCPTQSEEILLTSSNNNSNNNLDSNFGDHHQCQHTIKIGSDHLARNGTDPAPPSPLPSMQHCHDLSMNEAMSKQSRVAMIKLICGLIICTVFMAIELVGGHLSHSLAIFTDAAHLFSDVISFVISLVAVYLSTRKPTKSKTFGYLRMEIIGVLLSVFLIWFLTGILVYFAIRRLIHMEFKIHSESMLVVAMIGLFMNIVMWLVLADPCNRFQQKQKEEKIPIHDDVMKQHDVEHHHDNHNHNHNHHHHHHHSHQHGHHGHSHMNMNVRAAILHIFGDMIQSVGVLLAAIIIHYRPEWKVADPICTLLFATLVFMTTYSIMKDTLYILMEGFPAEYSYEQVKQMLLKQIQGVQHVHSLHIWSLTHGHNALSVHLTTADDCTVDDYEHIRNQAESLIRQELGINEMTIQIERHQPQFIDTCPSCIGPLN